MKRVMRKLIWNDAYEAAKILKKITIKLTKDDIEKIDNQYAAGINAIKNAIADSGEARKEIDAFLGGLFGMTGEEFNQLDMDEAIECIEAFTSAQGAPRFFKLVGRLMS